MARAEVVEVVRDLGGMERLGEEWRALSRRCADPTPFQSPEWILPWWRHFGEGGDPRFVSIRDGQGRLVGLAPLYAGNNPERGGERTLWFMGTGVSDYGDVLIEPGWEEALWEAVETAAEAEAGLRRVDLQQVRAGSSLLGRERSRFAIEVAPQVPCPVVPLTTPRKERISEKLRKDLRACRRKLEKAGAVRFERAEPSNAGELLEGLNRLHAARWPEEDGGMLAGERLKAFHREVVADAAAAGMLRLYGLRLDGNLVGCYYGFLVGHRAYAYLTGFDPAWEHFGIGNQLLDHAMSEAEREGAAAFDLLRGQEPYKYRWGARDEPAWRLQFGSDLPVPHA